MKNATRETAVVEYSAAAIKVLHFAFEPGKLCFRTHWHDRMEILRIHSGSMQIDAGVQTLCVGAGDLIIIPPTLSHKGYTQDEHTEYDVLMFDLRSFYNATAVCRDILPALFDGTARLNTVTRDAETLHQFDAICGCENKDSLAVIAGVYRLLHLFLQNDSVVLQSPRENTTIRESIAYIEANFAQELNIEVLSKQFGYSTAYFCRKFKNTTGLTPMAYLNIYRLEQAYQRIKSDTAPISEIAAQCGFSDANYFTRCFKKHFGAPPTQYRRR